jgi:hypothetical protein
LNAVARTFGVCFEPVAADLAEAAPPRHRAPDGWGGFFARLRDDLVRR